jgi:hypothetical protein
MIPGRIERKIIAKMTNEKLCLTTGMFPKIQPPRTKITTTPSDLIEMFIKRH